MNTNEKLSAYFIKQMALDEDRLQIASIDLLVFDGNFNILVFLELSKDFKNLPLLAV